MPVITSPTLAILKLEDAEKEIWTKAQMDFALALVNQGPLYNQPSLPELARGSEEERGLASIQLHAIIGVASSLADRIITYRRQRANIITRASSILE